jgi:hypothetical protein
MTFNVAEFRANLVGDGARPNLFQVVLTLPTFANNSTAAGQKLQFMAKSAQLPGSTIGQVPMYYFGREVKFAGNRTFTDWTIQIVNDEDFVIRNSMESWMSAINSHAGNLRAGVASNPTNYAVDAVVNQYGKTGNIINSYKFVGMFPLDVAPIDLDWGSNDAIEEYGVTFAYQYWTNAASTDSNG